jgi:predicted ATP-grasp superfamily ATP-dependent carboligase
MTVLVTCGHTRAGLAAVRGLGRAGVAVAVAAPQRPALAMWSRYATTTLLLPDAASEAKRFAAAVADELSGRHADGALAATDAALWALSRWRSGLSANAQAFLPPHEAVVLSLDRSALRDRARTLGVAAVPTWRIDSPKDVEPVVLRLQQQVAGADGRLWALVRPMVPSVEREDGTRRVATAIPVESVGGMRRLLYDREDLVDGGCLIELRPPGDYLGYGAVCRDGQVIAEVFQERLRERGDLSGVSTFARTIPVDDAIRSAGRAILKGLKFNGPCLVEFTRGDDGAVRLVNVIPRLWGSLALAMHAGVNVPWLVTRLARGDDVEPGHISRPGVVWRWVVGDLEVLAQRLGRLLSRVEGRGVIRRRAAGLRELLELRDLWRARPDVFELDDPLPSALELKQRLEEIRASQG